MVRTYSPVPTHDCFCSFYLSIINPNLPKYIRIDIGAGSLDDSSWEITLKWCDVFASFKPVYGRSYVVELGLLVILLYFLEVLLWIEYAVERDVSTSSDVYISYIAIKEF